MKSLIILCILLLGLEFGLGQTNSFEMPLVAARLPTTSFTLANQIPRHRLAKLPENLPVFRYSMKPREFSTSGLQALLDQSVFAGTNITTLLHGRTDASSGAPIRLASAQHLDYFFVDAEGGTISYVTQNKGVNLRTETPAYDSVPNFESITDALLRYAATFGISTNEMEHQNDGSILLRKSDDKTVARGGQIKFINRRTVQASRNMAGYPLLVSNDKVELALGVKGRLLRFDLKWPVIEVVRTNRLFTITQIMDNIKKGRALVDVMNQYPAEGVSEIILRDYRIFYYTPETRNFRPASTNTAIIPIVSFHAIFKSKRGKSEDGGLFVELLEP